tara:strand:+ start:171 stop:491 length:321 start_codon:yes stop_codon:yes gene_type:complete
MPKKSVSINYYIFILIIIFSSNIKADQQLDLGKQIFLEKGACASCHTLTDAGSYGNIGPNLNEIRPDMNRVMTAVINGIGVMPAYEGLLSKKEIEAVSQYVSKSVD